MIHVTISRNKTGLIQSFRMTGHADSGAYGQDIVCAAASVLAINTVNSTEQIAKVHPVVESDDENGGQLTAKFDQVSNLADPILQALLESFTLGMRDVAASYANYIDLHETTY